MIKSWKYLSVYSSVVPLDWHPYDYIISIFGNGVIILFESIIGRVLSPTFKNLTIHIIIWIIRLNQQSHMTSSTNHMTTCSFTTNIRHWTITIHHYPPWGPFLLLRPNTSSAFLILTNLVMKYMPPLALALLLSLDFTQSIDLHFRSLWMDVLLTFLQPIPAMLFTLSIQGRLKMQPGLPNHCRTLSANLFLPKQFNATWKKLAWKLW